MQFEYDSLSPKPADGGARPERATFAYDALGRTVPSSYGSEYDPVREWLSFPGAVGLVPGSAWFEYGAARSTPPFGMFAYDALRGGNSGVGSRPLDSAWAEYGSAPPVAGPAQPSTPPCGSFCYDLHGRAIPAPDSVSSLCNMIYDCSMPEADAPIIVPFRPH